MQEKSCPRCGAKFICRHNDDILKCQCATVQLTPEARQYISENYTDCLCANCLCEISESKPWLNI